uniref:Uncharacterized protein n=1 Tax=Spongospora subterranea TaxID=70186 RepID=A0A0H5RH34_9EUKA|eukprot:CRZ07994.1 hypothetical protein [Spongospora subterranea]
MSQFHANTRVSFVAELCLDKVKPVLLSCRDDGSSDLSRMWSSLPIRIVSPCSVKDFVAKRVSVNLGTKRTLLMVMGGLLSMIRFPFPCASIVSPLLHVILNLCFVVCFVGLICRSSC